MYGIHACEAALQNDSRQIQKIMISAQLKSAWQAKLPPVPVQEADGAEIANVTGAGAVHQGIAMLVQPLEEPYWDGVLKAARRICVLDQVTDPHNVGAILRSAAAFGVDALILPKDHCPPESATMAKTACGALERVPCLRVTNLSHTLGELKKRGFWILGMDAGGSKTIEAAKEYQPLCLVMGAEGAGLRRLTREACDLIVSIPIASDMESLNVSNAAAIAFYAAAGQEN